jgi:S1-C subfamily serine protease
MILIAPWFGRQLLWLALGAACVGQSAGAPAAEHIADVIEHVKPSVLAVGFFNETQSPRFVFRGTGFVAGDGNLLVTCAHVVDSDIQPGNEGRLVVLSSNGKGAGQIRRAEVLEVDKVHDLTVLRFDGKPLPALDLGKAASVREGQSVAFMGFPLGGALGFAPVTHRGMVSSITTVALPSPTAKQLDERSISRLREGAFEMLQLDATAYPGNSGGPLFDAETGEVVGVVNMVTLKGTRESALTHPSGISYAIPVEFVLQLHALLVHK